MFSLRYLKSSIRRLKRTVSRRSVRKRVATPLMRKSDPLLHAKWVSLINDYFPDRQDLCDYVVAWARRRQKRTLGSCNVVARRVNIAKELQYEEFYSWAEPVLYHELCHAVLGKDLIAYKGRRAWHGAEFKALEIRHPQTKALSQWMRNGGWLRAVRSHRARNR